MANNDPIGKALDMNPMPESNTKLVLGTVNISDNNDYEYARQNMYSIIETGANALDELATVAAQSQHPRAFEVLANMVKTLVDANKELVNLKKTKIDIQNAQENGGNDGSNGNVNFKNSIFVGSTAELQKLIKGMKEPDTKIIDGTTNDD